LVPFYYEITLQDHNPDTFDCDQIPFVFLQDNTPSHISKWTIRQLEKEGIPLLEHIGNSTDINAIEGQWIPMRIEITKQWDAPYTIE
jgi:hypothetical protein